MIRIQLEQTKVFAGNLYPHEAIETHSRDWDEWKDFCSFELRSESHALLYKKNPLSLVLNIFLNLEFSREL